MPTARRGFLKSLALAPLAPAALAPQVAAFKAQLPPGFRLEVGGPVESSAKANAAIGGSTNGIIHLTAVAGRLGIKLDLDRLDALGRAAGYGPGEVYRTRHFRQIVSRSRSSLPLIELGRIADSYGVHGWLAVRGEAATAEATAPSPAART